MRLSARIFIILLILLLVAGGVFVEQRQKFNTSDFVPYQAQMLASVQQFRAEQPLLEQPQSSVAEGYYDFRNEHYTQAYQALQPHALAGNVTSILVLGYLYEFGRGVQQDSKVASLWYFQAIIPNRYNQTPIARGLKAFYGVGAPVDYAKSAEWFRMAAELSTHG